MSKKPEKPKPAPARAPNRRRLSEAQIAAMDFELWQGEIDTKKLPDNEQFTEAGLGCLITCRLALVMMYKTKAELSEMFEQAGDTMVDLVEDMGRAKSFFSHFSELLDATSARLFATAVSVARNGVTPNAAPPLSHPEASRSVLDLVPAQGAASRRREGPCGEPW